MPTDAPTLSESSRAAARDYLRRGRKSPAMDFSGGYRWYAGDPAEGRLDASELPPAVFGRLRSCSERPWRFATFWLACHAASRATAEAIAAGELTP
jgi:hypothetical protein